jgi:hypothetical protein
MQLLLRDQRSGEGGIRTTLRQANKTCHFCKSGAMAGSVGGLPEQPLAALLDVAIPVEQAGRLRDAATG